MRTRTGLAGLALILGACTVPGASGPSGGAVTIPDSALGRWGLSPADCTSPRAQALGLLVVAPTTLDFYESRGILRSVEERSPTRIVGTFAFTGEGVGWTSRMILETRDGGETLVRREIGENTAPNAVEYVACG